MLQDIRGVGVKTILLLDALGIKTVDDLINFYPTKYIDLSSEGNPQDAIDGSFVFLKVLITNKAQLQTKSRLRMLKLKGLCQNIPISITYFNATFQSKIINVDGYYNFYGKIKTNPLQMVNPLCVDFEQGDNDKIIKPIYRTMGIIGQGIINNLVLNALTLEPPYQIVSTQIAGSSLNDAYLQIHKPTSIDILRQTRDRILLDRLVAVLLSYRQDKLLIRDPKAICYEENDLAMKKIMQNLPFTLTSSQSLTIDKILKTLQSKYPLNAMLVGDVGSGKTIVALLTSYYVALSHHQVALMAPTEILARQHYSVFTKILSNMGITVELLTASLTVANKKKIYIDLLTGKIDILIGTQALITDKLEFKSLGLVIFDEQHRFGVRQRTDLLNKGKGVDTLTMSATPIPRTLQLSLFKDIDFLSIEPRYNVNNITTSLVPLKKRTAMFDYIVEQCIEKGTQAFIVAPKIEDDEGIDVNNVEGLYKELTEKYNARCNIGFVHGKISAIEKQTILDNFYSGITSVLVSTTVVEVGIDVPNASIIAIMDAERFGLATLHQLRGRVGRNGAKAFCFLFTSSSETPILERLRSIVNERDGMAIAEKDAELRGMGEVFGTVQSGQNNLFRGLTLSLLNKAKKIADSIDIAEHTGYLESVKTRLKLWQISLN